MALYTEPLWVALFGLIHRKHQKSAVLVDYKHLKDADCSVLHTVNQTHSSTQNILCYTTALSRIGNHLRCNTAYNIWKCITDRALNGIKLCTDVRTQINVLGRDNSAAVTFTASIHPCYDPHSSHTTHCKQAACHKTVIPVYILQLHMTRMHPPAAMPFYLFRK
jgi:hypothetical protein